MLKFISYVIHNYGIIENICMGIIAVIKTKINSNTRILLTTIFAQLGPFMANNT